MSKYFAIFIFVKEYMVSLFCQNITIFLYSARLDTVLCFNGFMVSKANTNRIQFFFLPSDKYVSLKDSAYKVYHQLFLPSSPQQFPFLSSPRRVLPCFPFLFFTRTYFLEERTSIFFLAKLCQLLSFQSNSKCNS
jgi:hypothetical protein